MDGGKRMATTKADMLKLIEGLPDDVSIEDVMAKLYARKKIERGIEQLDAGKGVTHERAKDRLKPWLP